MRCELCKNPVELGDAVIPVGTAVLIFGDMDVMDVSSEYPYRGIHVRCLELVYDKVTEYDGD